jgi:hypothetical protein
MDRGLSIDPRGVMSAKTKRAATPKRAAPKHIPAPQIVAVVARDDGDTITVPGDSRRRGVWNLAPFKLVLLDVCLLSVAPLIGRDVRPIDIDDLEDAERARLTQAIAYALEDLGR